MGRTPLSAASLLLLLLLKLLGWPQREQQVPGSRNKAESIPGRQGREIDGKIFVKTSETSETSEEEDIISGGEDSCMVTNPKTGAQVGNDVHYIKL